MRRTPKSRQRLPGFQTLREIAIVVVGILIAFALDAWWQQRGAAARERAHLRALASDFQQNAERLRDLVRLKERVSVSSRELLLIAREGRAAPADSIQRLLSMVFTSGRFEPVMGAYEALEHSAGLTALRNDSLRAALAGFAAQLDVRYAEEFSTELYLALLREFAGELSYFASAVAGEGERAAAGAPPALLRDPRFQEYLALRHLTERDVAREYRRWARQAERILAHLKTAAP